MDEEMFEKLKPYLTLWNEFGRKNKKCN
jgi:hypothetical protein